MNTFEEIANLLAQKCRKPALAGQRIKYLFLGELDYKSFINCREMIRYGNMGTNGEVFVHFFGMKIEVICVRKAHFMEVICE